MIHSTLRPFSARHRREGRKLLGKWEDGLRYLAATLFTLLLIFCVVGIPVILVITSTYGLGESVRKIAEETLGGPFYKVTLDRVRFNPTQGVILEALQLHDRTPAQRLVVSADRLAISINLEALLRKQIQLERIALRDATLDVPLGPAEQPRLRLDHVRALILCPPEQFRLTTASFEVDGIFVNASGTFRNPKKFSPKAVSSKGPGNIALTIESIQKELKSVQWEGARPVLTIDAGGDLSDSESLRVERAAFRSGSGEWHGIGFRSAAIDLQYAAKKLSLENISLDDGMGVLQAAGWADFGEKSASLEFAGALNAGVLPGLLDHKHSHDWHWIDPLRLHGNFAASWKNGPPAIEGNALMQSGRFIYHGVAINSVSGGIALHEGKVLLRDFHLEGDPGTVDADLLIAPGDNRLRLKASIFPIKLAPLASGKSKEALSSMDFQNPLMINFEGGASGMDPLLLKGSGNVSLGKAAMRGAAIDGLTANLRMENGAADFNKIFVKMGDGVGQGEFIYDFKNWEGRLIGIRTSLDAGKVMMWIDPRIADALKPYRFRKHPELHVSGKVGLRNPQKNDLLITVNAPAGLDYTLIGKNLSFGATAGSVLLRGQKLTVDIPAARLFQGSVAMKADVSVAPGDGSYGATVHVEEIDFQSLTKLYFGYDQSKGQLTADYAFRTMGKNERAMVGEGNLLIKNGNVLAMPVLGPLSVLIGDVIPGFGYQTAHTATADFTVADGVINTRNLLIQGTGFSMIGHGDIFYLDDRMNMSIRLNISGLPGILTFPISKALEYESVGSAKHPKWRPKIIPKGL